MSIEAIRPGHRRPSWLYLLNNTPLRDLLRGQLTGRLGCEYLIETAGLASPAAEFIRRAVRPTSGWGVSKLAAARELIALFRDRLEAGASVESVIALCGDIEQARALVRRGWVSVLALPSPCRDVIVRVVRRTRLWRGEKADVTGELAAHFRDGTDAGNSPEALIESFGDERQAARLIRRAKIRNRPVAWKALRWTVRAVGAACLLAILLHAGLTARLYMGSPRLAHNYWDELNAPIAAIPEQDRAWPLYRRAVLSIEVWPKNGPYGEVGPHDDVWEQLAAHAEANQEAIRLFRAAAAKPHFGTPLSPQDDREILEHLGMESSSRWRDPGIWAQDNPPLFDIYNAEKLVSLWWGARLLQVDGRLAALEGDAERAAADVSAMLQMAEHAFQQPTLIADLNAMALITRATNLIGSLLEDWPELFSEEALIALSHRFAAAGGGGRLRVELADQRAKFQDLVQRLYTDDGHGGGHPVPEFLEIVQSITGDSKLRPLVVEHPIFHRLLAMPALSAVIADRRDLLREYDEFMALAEAEAALPLWEHGESRADQAVMEMMATLAGRYRHLLIALCHPGPNRVGVLTETATQQRDAVLVAIALELYRRDHGDWPASLHELSPQYLPTVPPDRYDGKPLKYRIVEGQPVLYSVGVDRDDDGGRVPEQGKWQAQRWQPPSVIEELKAAGSPSLPDGDWILWPPVD